MDLPSEPRAGSVIRDSYLWSNEADKGLEEGCKDRPCAVVLAVRKDNENLKVVVAPITHTLPAGDPEALEVPQATKQRLGLDDERSWIITNDLNIFDWPGPDVRVVSEETGFFYGELPAKLTQKLVGCVIRHMQGGLVRPVDRLE